MTTSYEIERYIDNEKNENEITATFIVDVCGEYRSATFSDPEEHPETEITDIVLTIEAGGEEFSIPVDVSSKLYAALVKSHREEVEQEAFEAHVRATEDDDDDYRY